MKRYLLILVFVLAAATVSAARIDTVAVFSAKMRRDIPALVVVPDAGIGQRMPVLYLLHGYSGSYMTWQRDVTDLRPLADAYGMIIACPDGANSWYWDSPLDPSSQFETFVSQEFPDWIDAHYLTIPSREGRAITGLSMGGHGALWTALRHKDRFGAAGSTSGGVDIRPFPDSWEMKKQLGELKQHPERWDAHTVINQADGLSDGELALVIDCGYQDFFYQVNVNLHEKLLQRGVSHDFLTRPGEHNSAYWSNSLPYQVLFFHRYFQRQTPPEAVAVATGRRVVFIGDSITDGNWGKGDGKPSSERNLTDRNHLYGSGYMYLCASYYQGYRPRRGYLFFNRGVSGNTLDELAARWQEDVVALRPDVLSVLVGTNDVGRYLHGRMVSAAAEKRDFDFAGWEKTYRRLLDEARRANPDLKILLCTPFAAPVGEIAEGLWGEYYPLRQQLLARCCAVVERIAADYGAALVPFHRLVAGLETKLPNGDATYWVWDGIHPTPACHRRMADCWIEAAARSGAMD